MIIKFENFDYLHDHKKYCLLKIDENYGTSGGISSDFYIVKNLGNQFKKIYEIIDYELIRIDIDFYFTINPIQFEKELLFESDILNEVLDNIDLFIDSNKYNI
jgi:hypothetical protein